MALGLTLTVFGVLFDVAPPFVTKREVDWSNRNASVRHTSPVTFEEADFMPPLLTRVAGH
ncbi:hypothetical protein IE4872_PD00101 (plasmid) [Rhizobium gallicum]|uniref:Uncharacterized protein n=1 Tax=Rhizobium gallicum TaxID=56730 RepID=A0A1L5NRY1_9HYPH|nr:hypothetical protein IE4872_PD00101 [Rhizobium gallicum]